MGEALCHCQLLSQSKSYHLAPMTRRLFPSHQIIKHLAIPRDIDLNILKLYYKSLQLNPDASYHV